MNWDYCTTMLFYLYLNVRIGGGEQAQLTTVDVFVRSLISSYTIPTYCCVAACDVGKCPQLLPLEFQRYENIVLFTC